HQLGSRMSLHGSAAGGVERHVEGAARGAHRPRQSPHHGRPESRPARTADHPRLVHRLSSVGRRPAADAGRRQLRGRAGLDSRPRASDGRAALLRLLEHGAGGNRIMSKQPDCDVVIVGAGVAGWILAGKLGSQGVKVIVLQASPGKQDGDARDAYVDNFKVGGTPYPLRPAALKNVDLFTTSTNYYQ